MNQKDHKFIFVVGGVMSSVGKGVASASIGKILQGKGFEVTAIKIDPYINVDAGTMNPTEHGEVFVTEDGDETDQDIGNYERFLDRNIYSINYMTTGRVYQSVINRERNLEYQGKCVEVVPHVPMEVIDRIKKAAASANADFTIIEIGGTVGEYQNVLFLEALRMLKTEMPEKVLTVMVSWLPIPSKVGEMKTKPTQYAVRSLNSAGIFPDFLLCRAERPLDEIRKNKLAMFCNVPKENVISAPDVDTIYDIPINFENDGFGLKILAKFGIAPREVDLKEWRALRDKISGLKEEVKIGIAGKYFEVGEFTLADAYISVIEAIKHASWANGRIPKLTWLNSEDYEKDASKLSELEKFDGIVVPGGFGSRGVEGKIKVIEWCRLNNKPYFGLCYGMQTAVIEYARNILGLKDANSMEMNPETKNPVIAIMEEQKEKLAKKQMGGSMRLGAFDCRLDKKSISFAAYGAENISERHRHRYEFNNKYREQLAEAGLLIAGVNPQSDLVEIVEVPKNKFHVGVQFHPEFKSRPLSPHPLFVKFIEKAVE